MKTHLLTALTFVICIFGQNANAEQTAKVAVVLEDGNSYVFPNMKLRNGSGRFSVEILPQRAETTIKYSEIGRVIVSQGDGFPFIGTIEMSDGRSFQVKARIDHILGRSHGKVPDPVTGGFARFDFDYEEVAALDFTQGSVGSYRVADDGRIYPSFFIYDPRNGKRMTLTDSP